MNERGKRAVIYTRVSRDDSGEGASNKRQEADCRKLAELRGWNVIGVFEDISVSAYSGKVRPEWEQVTELVRTRSVDVVVAWHMDRVTRTVRELSNVIDLFRHARVSLVTVSGDIDLSNETGKAVATILGAVAEMEVERKGARQRRANLQRATDGVPWSSGFRAFGYQLDGTVIAEEAEHIVRAATDALAGVSMKEIERQWTSKGLRSVHAKAGNEKGWTARGIKALLTNPRHAGIATYKGEPVGKGQWEPILTDEQHAELVAKLTDPRRRTNRATAGRKPVYLLSTIAECSACGQTVGGRKTNGNPVYSCQPSNHVNTHREVADEYALHVFEEAVKAFGPMQLQLGAEPVESGQHDSEIDEIASLHDRRKALTAAMVRGDIAGDDYETGLASLRARESELSASILTERPMLRRLSDGSTAYLDEFHSAPIAAQREALNRALSITLHPIGQGRRNVPIAEQVEVWIKHRSGELIAAKAVTNTEQEAK